MDNETKDRLRRAYREALECQNACNLSGVAQSFAEHTKALWREADEFDQGTDYVNRHPVTVWFLYKMLDLAGRPDSDARRRAYAVLNAVKNGAVEVGSPEHLAMITRTEKV